MRVIRFHSSSVSTRYAFRGMIGLRRSRNTHAPASTTARVDGMPMKSIIGRESDDGPGNRGAGAGVTGSLGGYRDCFQKRTATHFDNHCRGLLSDLLRKSVELTVRRQGASEFRGADQRPGGGALGRCGVNDARKICQLPRVLREFEVLGHLLQLGRIAVDPRTDQKGTLVDDTPQSSRDPRVSSP